MNNLDVLLVDDSREKLEAIIRLLMSLGLTRSAIDVSLTGDDAREKLRNRAYTVMILDLAIPRKPEDLAAPDGGIELLEELFERGGFQIPRYIVTVTAHDELVEKYRQTLDERLIHLVRYDVSTDKWQRQLTSFLNDLKKTTATALTSEKSFGVDILIVAALRNPELRAIRDLDWGFAAARSLDQGTLYYAGSANFGGRSCNIIASACPRMGPVAAAIHTTRMIEAFRPRVLVMPGICAGMRGNTDYGDVIVATPAWDWQSGKKVGTKGRPQSAAFQIQPHQIEADSRVIAAFEQLAEDSPALAGIVAKWRGNKPRNLPRILPGPVASGASVVADGETIEDIKRTQHRKLLGLDMESYAVYAAAKDISPPRPIFFSAKAVCDHADPKKSDDYQDYAAFVSAEVTALVLDRAVASLLGD